MAWGVGMGWEVTGLLVMRSNGKQRQRWDGSVQCDSLQPTLPKVILQEETRSNPQIMPISPRRETEVRCLKEELVDLRYEVERLRSDAKKKDTSKTTEALHRVIAQTLSDVASREVRTQPNSSKEQVVSSKQ